jgi:hypothetical protein
MNITISKEAALAPRKVYVQAFGRSRCVACHRETTGKLCDYVIGSCGGYYTSCVPLCTRCWGRVTKAVSLSTGGKIR